MDTSRGGVRLEEVFSLLKSTSNLNPSQGQVRNVLLDLVNEDILTFTIDRTLVLGPAQPKEATVPAKEAT